MDNELKIESVLQRAKEATVLAQRVADPEIQREISNVAVAWMRVAERMTGDAVQSAFAASAANSNSN